MDRAFSHFGGPGFRPPFRPFPHPFFPGRFLFPFFFFSPFFFPFFRDENGNPNVNPNNEMFAHHQAKGGDKLENVAHMYNMPYPLLEEANPHIENPKSLKHGESVYIPRISHMYCHKTYVEKEVEAPKGKFGPKSNDPSPWMPYQG